MNNKEPIIKNLAQTHVAFVSFTGNYIANPEIFKNLFDKLCGWAGPKGLITLDSMFLSAYQDDPQITPPDKLKLEVCISVPDDTIVDKDIQKKVLPGGTYIVMNAELKGPEEYGNAWNFVVEWIQKNNYEIDMSRPSYEIYLNNPEEHPEKYHIVDICMSVKEK